MDFVLGGYFYLAFSLFGGGGGGGVLLAVSSFLRSEAL